MRKNISKKSVFLISIYYRNVVQVTNPEPGKPKVDVTHHEIPLFIINSIQELIDFLSKYTDVRKFYHNDLLKMKWEFKEYKNNVLDILDFEKFKTEILADVPRYFPGANYFEENFNEKMIGIKRLPIGAQKRHLNEDLF